jgi:hypothetical protein
VLHQPEQRGRADEGRLDALHHRIAAEHRADPAARLGLAALAADQIGAGDLDLVAAVTVLRDSDHAVGRLHDVHDARAIENAQVRHRLGMREQDGLEEDLVDAMRRLGRRAPGVGPTGRGVALRAARDRDARQLDARGGRAIGDVVGIVRRQPGVAQRARDAKTPEDLHRARRDVIALGARRLAAPAQLGERHRHAAPREVHRERESHRPGPHDQHLRLDPAHRLLPWRATGIGGCSRPRQVRFAEASDEADSCTACAATERRSLLLRARLEAQAHAAERDVEVLRATDRWNVTSAWAPAKILPAGRGQGAATMRRLAAPGRRA